MTGRETLAEAHKTMTPAEIAAHALDLAASIEVQARYIASTREMLERALSYRQRAAGQRGWKLIGEFAAIEMPAVPPGLYEGKR